jgi:hypothetical protein
VWAEVGDGRRCPSRKHDEFGRRLDGDRLKDWKPYLNFHLPISNKADVSCEMRPGLPAARFKNPFMEPGQKPANFRPQ